MDQKYPLLETLLEEGPKMKGVAEEIADELSQQAALPWSDKFPDKVLPVWEVASGSLRRFTSGTGMRHHDAKYVIRLDRETLKYRKLNPRPFMKMAKDHVRKIGKKFSVGRDASSDIRDAFLVKGFVLVPYDNGDIDIFTKSKLQGTEVRKK